MRSPCDPGAPQIVALASRWEFGDASECPRCLLVAARTVPNGECFVACAYADRGALPVAPVALRLLSKRMGGFL